jgi:DNA-binding NarL/FixJ family response regulator
VRERTRVIVIDDHPVVTMGLRHPDQELEVVDAVGSVEDLLRKPPVDAEVVLLDLQLGAAGLVCGTEAIRLLLDNGLGPVVIYTSVAEDMILVACIAAGAPEP